jgi:hypothetical protein
MNNIRMPSSNGFMAISSDVEAAASVRMLVGYTNSCMTMVQAVRYRYRHWIKMVGSRLLSLLDRKWPRAAMTTIPLDLELEFSDIFNAPSKLFHYTPQHMIIISSSTKP